MKTLGKLLWMFSGGNMPLNSSGPEPEFTSHDRLCILNSGDEMAVLEMKVYFGDREPLGVFRLTVAARRLRQVRVNDFIFPQAIPLETPYAIVIRSTAPVVVQIGRADTSQAEHALTSVLAFPSA